jgi:hypothetical protein
MFGGGRGGAPLVNCSDVPITQDAWIGANMCRNAIPRFLETHLTSYSSVVLKHLLSPRTASLIIQSNARCKQTLLPSSLDRSLIIFVESN